MTLDRNDDVDQLLRAAGADWRATEPPGLTAHRRIESPTVAASGRRRWLLPGLAAASVLALAVSVVVGARVLRTDPDHRAAGVTGLAALVVRDGDQVRATGIVYRSAHGLQLCGPMPVADVGRAAPKPVGADAPTNCGTQHIAELTGVTDDNGTATVQVTGRWHDGSIAVQKVVAAAQPPPPAFVTPCQPPPGGWQPVDGMASADWQPVATYVAAHPARYALMWISREKGGPNYPNAEGGRSQLEIPTVGAVGDVTQARADLAAAGYDGPLCVYPVDYAQADLHVAVIKVKAALGSRALQVSANPVTDRVDVEVNVLSPDDAAALGEVDKLLDVQPRIVPA